MQGMRQGEPVVDHRFWTGKKVFLTGHTGFKGSWMCLWLHALGARVTGYALDPPTTPNLFEQAGIADLVRSVTSDVRDGAALSAAMSAAQPEIVFHMAAQPLVRDSYRKPADTYSVNVMGTVNLFESVRNCGSVKAVVNVTTDKCYENREWVWGYREIDRLGGFDPYSSSKACSELVTAAYRTSFFNPKDHEEHRVGVATARAGNVIGGGDWAQDRLVPDCMRALLEGRPVRIRNPWSVRPWQHVLDPLRGYLMLAQKLCEDGPRFSEPWNFGPHDAGEKPVEWIVQRICGLWGGTASYEIEPGEHPHESHTLRLDRTKAVTVLGWHPVWDLEQSLERVVQWTRSCQANGEVRSRCLREIEEHERDVEQAAPGVNREKREGRRNNG